MNLKLDPQIEEQLLSGTIGQGAAAEFVGFLRVFAQLPSPKEITSNPQTAKVPSEPSALYAVTGLVSRVINDKNVDKVAEYIQRLPNEFERVAVKQSIARFPEFSDTDFYRGWAAQNADVVQS